MNYFVNEGNRIGGQEPQGLSNDNKRITASVAVTKGDIVEVTGNWTVGPAADNSTKVCGIAANDAGVGEAVVIETEGFVKLTATGAIIAAGDKVVAGGSGKVKKIAGATVADALAVCGIVLAGCAADGNPYVKFTL